MKTLTEEGSGVERDPQKGPKVRFPHVSPHSREAQWVSFGLFKGIGIRHSCAPPRGGAPNLAP